MRFLRPDTKYARSGDVRIAYQTTGVLMNDDYFRLRFRYLITAKMRKISTTTFPITSSIVMLSAGKLGASGMLVGVLVEVLVEVYVEFIEVVRVTVNLVVLVCKLVTVV